MIVTTDPLISIVIPSLHRVDSLHACLKSIERTVLAWPVEVLCVIDCYPENAKSAASVDAVQTLYSETRRGGINAWNDGLVASQGSFVVFAGDDLIFEQGWLTKSMKAMLDMREDGLVGFNDNHRDGNQLATHYLASRSFIRKELGGRIAFPIFQFYCNDTLANRLAKNAGKFQWANDAFVVHHHYTSGDHPRPKDFLDEQNEQVLSADIQAFHNWMERGSKIEWEPLI